MRRLALVAVGLVALVVTAAPAGAIETTEFGIDPAGTGAKVTAPVRAGTTTASRVQVWNKSGRPLALRLGVAPVTVDRYGTASLGGDPEPVGWVKLAERQVTLGPGERRVVDFGVHPPRQITGGTRTVAIMAEPVAAGDAAVLQRLAVVAYLTPTGSLQASLGWLGWLAAGLCVLVAGAFAFSALRRATA